jgi:glycosyltransferase 2 family protein
MKKILNILKYLLFLTIGAALFYYVYKGTDIGKLQQELKTIHWGWIWLSLLFSILSHVSRALRWNMLIEPLGYKTNSFRSFCSVMAMYFTNLIIPRGGELARCTLLSRTEKIPFTTLVGTVVVERATDTLLLFILMLITLLLQIDIFNHFLANNPDFGSKLGILLSPWLWIIVATIGLGSLVLLWRYRIQIKQIRFLYPILSLIQKFVWGLKSVGKLEKPLLYVAHSLFIYLMYFLMMYVVFFSYDPTKNMSIVAGLAAFIMGSLAMLAPVQAGVGAWHFMIFETLALYGLDRTDGKVFALLCHTSTNFLALILGAGCLMYLTIFARKHKQDLSLQRK